VGLFLAHCVAFEVGKDGSNFTKAFLLCSLSNGIVSRLKGVFLVIDIVLPKRRMGLCS